jgi:hypothetical protein
MNDLNVSRYLEYVLDNIQNKKLEDLLPYSPNLDKSLRNTKNPPFSARMDFNSPYKKTT